VSRLLDNAYGSESPVTGERGVDTEGGRERDQEGGGGGPGEPAGSMNDFCQPSFKGGETLIEKGVGKTGGRNGQGGKAPGGCPGFVETLRKRGPKMGPTSTKNGTGRAQRKREGGVPQANKKSSLSPTARQ